jgi:hypothetical protein
MSIKGISKFRQENEILEVVKKWKNFKKLRCAAVGDE